jgi:DNA polymerase III sliding clamp (beta) subunit (PCNA family)
LIEGSYPNHRQIVPHKNSTRLTTNNTALRKACKQAEICERTNGRTARLTIQAGQVEIQDHSEETGSTGSIIEAAVAGPGLEIVFNVIFLR